MTNENGHMNDFIGHLDIGREKNVRATARV